MMSNARACQSQWRPVSAKNRDDGQRRDRRQARDRPYAEHRSLEEQCPARKSAGPPSTVATVSGLACPNGWTMTNSSPTAVTMIPATIGMWR